MCFSHKVIFLNLGENFFFLFCLTEEWFMFIFVFLWNFKCFIHISDSVRWKTNLQMQIWLCLKSALCCFAAYLWEMIVLYYKVSCIHIFIKCGLINHEFLQPQFFHIYSSLPAKYNKNTQKYNPEYLSTKNSVITWLWCLMVSLCLWRPLKRQSTVLSFQVSCIVCVIDH